MKKKPRVVMSTKAREEIRVALIKKARKAHRTLSQEIEKACEAWVGMGNKI